MPQICRPAALLRGGNAALAGGGGYPEAMSLYDTGFWYHALEEFDPCLDLLP